MSYEYRKQTQEISRAVAAISKEIPDTMKGFRLMSQAADSEGVLDRKTKELIAMGIGIAVRCQGCVGFHAKALVDLGTTRQEFMELISVAVYMGGGPSLMTAAEALMAFEEFQALKAPASAT